jgi:hypothetical protein
MCLTVAGFAQSPFTGVSSPLARRLFSSMASLVVALAMPLIAVAKRKQALQMCSSATKVKQAARSARRTWHPNPSR